MRTEGLLEHEGRFLLPGAEVIVQDKPIPSGDSITLLQSHNGTMLPLNEIAPDLEGRRNLAQDIFDIALQRIEALEMHPRFVRGKGRYKIVGNIQFLHLAELDGKKKGPLPKHIPSKTCLRDGCGKEFERGRWSNGYLEKPKDFARRKYCSPECGRLAEKERRKSLAAIKSENHDRAGCEQTSR